VRRPRAAVLLGVTAVALVLASCSDPEKGEARPADTTEPAPATSDERPTTSSDSGEDDLPSNGAPKVENPIDVSEFEQQPCRMLTDEQVRQAGLVPPGAPGEGAYAPACDWRNRESGANLNTQFGDPSRRGLSAGYAANEAGKFDLWLELDPVDGFPAVAFGLRDLRQSGECTIMVGTSDEVTFQLSVELSEAKRGKADPCEAAAQVAALSLQTMKANS
jgi:hypothetical protein